ncbi:MAG: hypothetical protein KKG76_09405 [Euryarchaeota archaeon]|nr:hypothetical protein [Euryarchaeota archaeon]
MTREPKYNKQYVLWLAPVQHEFLMETYGKGNMARAVRKKIDEDILLDGRELPKLRKEFEEVEPHYNSLKKKIAELELIEKQKEDDQKTRERHIEDAHEKLLEALKRALWEPERIQRATYKIYADATGLSVQELMDWVNEQAKRRDELE